jgi:hypothetical protein
VHVRIGSTKSVRGRGWWNISFRLKTHQSVRSLPTTTTIRPRGNSRFIFVYFTILFSVGAKYFFFISAPSGYATFRFMVRYKYAAIKTLILHADLSIIGQYGDLVKKNHSTTSSSAIYGGRLTISRTLHEKNSRRRSPLRTRRTTD